MSSRFELIKSVISTSNYRNVCNNNSFLTSDKFFEMDLGSFGIKVSVCTYSVIIMC